MGDLFTDPFGNKKAAETQAEANRKSLAAQEKVAAEAKARRDEAIKLKQKAIADTPFPTLLEVPEAQQFKQTLQDRIAGRGLIDVQKETAPVAAQVRAGLEQTKAAIGSSASAAGLGRSSLVGAQTGAASQAAERDIASRLSNLELVRQEQIGQAVTQFGSLAEAEAVSQQNKARFKVGNEFNVADTISRDAEATKNDQFAISNTIASNGANEAAWQLLNAQILMSGLLGAGESYAAASSGGSTALLSKLTAEQSSRGASVNTGSSNVLGEQIGSNLGGFNF